MDKKIEALNLLLDAVVDIVAEEEFGVPGGTLYAVLMPYDIDFEAFQSIMLVLVKQNRLKKEGHVYYVV